MNNLEIGDIIYFEKYLFEYYEVISKSINKYKLKSLSKSKFNIYNINLSLLKFNIISKKKFRNEILNINKSTKLSISSSLIKIIDSCFNSLLDNHNYLLLNNCDSSSNFTSINSSESFHCESSINDVFDNESIYIDSLDKFPAVATGVEIYNRLYNSINSSSGSLDELIEINKSINSVV